MCTYKSPNLLFTTVFIALYRFRYFFSEPYLEKIIIVNYQSCQNVIIELNKDEPTILIGINDCGKSTLLKAVDLLLDGKTQFNFYREDKIRNDISNTRLKKKNLLHLLIQNGLPDFNYYEKQTIIIGKLIVENINNNENLDKEISKHLSWVLENSDNVIWLMKLFDEESKGSKDYILSLDSEDELSLWKNNATELKKLQKDFEVTTEEIENENQSGRFKNIEIIRAIYNKIKLKSVWAEYTDKKKDKAFYPEINYLDWNFTFDDLLLFTTNIMNQSISESITATKNYAVEESKKAQENINKNLNEIVQYFHNELPTIQQLKSNVFFNVNSKITDLTITKDNTDKDIHLDSQGDGIKRLIWFAMIKWKALKTISEIDISKKLIWCFDEPETHLYPAAQRIFFDKIKEISKGNVQTIISTHSTIFVDRAKLENINSLELLDGYTKINKCENPNDAYNALRIKNSDFLFYDYFIVVEGATDYFLLPHLFNLYFNSTILEQNYQIIKLDGETNFGLQKSSFESLLRDFNKNSDSVYYMLDSDVKYKSGKDFTSNCNVYFVGKQDLEDSIGSEIWFELVKQRINQYEVNDITVSINDIDKIKNEIRQDIKIEKNQKFYAKLNKIIKNKIFEKRTEYLEILPDKGESLANDLSKLINNKAHLPNDVVKFFENLPKS